VEYLSAPFPGYALMQRLPERSKPVRDL